MFGGYVGAVSLSNGAGVVLGSWSGTSPLDSGWLDTSENGNDGTVSGSPNAAISADCGATWSEVV